MDFDDYDEFGNYIGAEEVQHPDEPVDTFVPDAPSSGALIQSAPEDLVSPLLTPSVLEQQSTNDRTA
jgi:hypothetical protein